MAPKHYTLHFNQGKCDIVTAIRISSHNFILLSTSWKNPPFSTISETCFHISLQFLKLTFIFSTNSISLRFWELDFTGKYFSTISVTCFHLSTISETYFHLSTISISLQIWTHPNWRWPLFFVYKIFLDRCDKNWPVVLFWSLLGLL